MKEKKVFLPFNHLWLKVIAIFLMTLDHVGLFFFPASSSSYLVLRGLGRLAFPLFAFISVEGVFKSHNNLLYALRLLLTGLLIDLCLYLYTKQYLGNALVELGLGVLALALFSKLNLLSLLGIIPLTIMILADYSFFPIRSEYGLVGALIMLAFFFAHYLSNMYFKNLSKQMGIDIEAAYGNEKSQLIRNAFSCGLFVWVEMILYLFYVFNPNLVIFTNFFSYGIEQISILSVFPIMLYSGKKGYSNKYLNISFYLYYPLHFVILYFILSLISA
jgi:hypothetical protein